ncbi:AMP-binding protein [Tropicimonas sp. IMCC34011]|uniref:AMP-binding protein n=1 Tax=Tropicimonas sp. IMCC34011 TaxID=2248759 RepID=UPI001E302126|nr:AMP-binding protein [Tropicimonas sp. IMCC34011]
MQAGSVFALLERQSGHYAENDLLVLTKGTAELWSSPRRRWSYAEMLEAIRTLSDRYAAAGLGAGDRVALLLENRPDHFAHWLALNRLGASAVPVNPSASAAELTYLLEHSEAKLLVRLDAHADLADPVAAELGLPAIGPEGQIPRIGETSAPAAPELSRECALIYTSGTTGKPKGCILSNRYFLNWATWYDAQGGFISLRKGRERLLTPLPTFHVNAMGHSFMGMLSCGGAQIIMDRFHPRSWWADAAETGATCFHYLGVMPAILLELPEGPEDQAHGMRFGLGGGVHPDHHERFEARFGVPILEGWAMTETGGAGTFCAASEQRHTGTRAIGRPDRPGPPLEARLIEEDGSEVEPGAPGELVLRAAGDDPRVGFFSGYLKNAEETEKVWQGGWLRTGDVMRASADGTLHFVERRKNIIRRSGENIAASEVEGVVLSVPGVSGAAVISSPDPLREEEVLAVIVPEGDRSADALAEAVFAACAERLSYFKVPGYIVFRDSLPTTSTQKVQKHVLRSIAAAPMDEARAFDLRARKQALRTDAQ